MSREEIIKNVLEYWHTIEFLNQENFPVWSSDNKKKSDQTKENVLKNKENKDEVKQYKTLQMLLEIKEDGKKIYDVIKECAKEHDMIRWGNITFYIGKVERERCIENIAAALHCQDKREERNIDKIAWFGLQTGPDLVYNEDSASLSPIIWVMKKLNEKREEDNFSDILKKVSYDSDILEYDNNLKSISREGISAKTEKNSKKLEKRDLYKLDADKEYIEENAYALQKEHLEDLRRNVFQKYLKNNVSILEENFFKENADSNKSIWISFKLYKEEKTWNDDIEEDYYGLSRTYIISDLEMVMKEANSLQYSSAMHKKLADYICSKYEEVHESENSKIDLLRQFEKNDDISAYKKLLLDILDPDNAPMGKWPSRYMPALMQQVAINLAIEGNNTIFSVNGPPGTGKTTLLKEIVVHNVVERARLLAEYNDPDEAFEDFDFKCGPIEKGNSYSRFATKYHGWKDNRINDYSMVVASSNNSAVENISKEFPMEHGIIDSLKENKSDTEQMIRELSEVEKKFTVSENSVNKIIQKSEEIGWNKRKENAERSEREFTEKFPNCKDIYFTKYIQNLFPEEHVWGLIAAPLGNKKNISKFYKAVLERFSFAACKNEKMERKLRLQNYREVRRSFEKQLEIVTDKQNQLKCLSDIEKKDEQNKLQRKRENLLNSREELLERIKDDKERKLECQEALNKAEADCSLKYEQYKESEKACSTGEEKYSEYYRKYLEAEASRGELHISFISKALKMRKAKEAEEKYDFLSETMNSFRQEMERIRTGGEELARENKEKQQQYHQTKRKKTQIEQELKKIEDKLEKVKKEIRNVNREIYNCDLSIEKLKQILQSVSKNGEENDTTEKQCLNDEYLQDIVFGDSDVSTEAHVKNPWFYQEYNREREKLFYEALRFQEAFILASVSCRDNLENLSLYWKMKKGGINEDQRIEFMGIDRENAIEKMFQTLFLLVPVISVTFASVGGFFRDVAAGGIGTLIVDEAGQALPQMAVGALYRAKKAIIVGDPRQIEPVVTDDLKLLKQAYKNDEICRLYLSKNVSVQTFADSLNPYGTWLDADSETPEWIGCPLIVHRRCIAPMFEISNEISYSNIMKQKTMMPDMAKQKTFIYPESRWIAVKGAEKGNKNHFVKEQASKVIDMLETAFAKNKDANIYIITPFTTVMYEMRRMLVEQVKRNPKSNMNKNNVKEWADANIGTVHTFQGKEANEVIFLLGCDNSERAEGAIKWVPKSIVNVAVTRAKYRLYVVGDDEAWKKSDSLNLVLESLKKFNPEEE